MDYATNSEYFELNAAEVSQPASNNVVLLSESPDANEHIAQLGKQELKQNIFEKLYSCHKLEVIITGVLASILFLADISGAAGMRVSGVITAGILSDIVYFIGIAALVRTVAKKQINGWLVALITFTRYVESRANQ